MVHACFGLDYIADTTERYKSKPSRRRSSWFLGGDGIKEVELVFSTNFQRQKLYCEALLNMHLKKITE